MTLNKKIINTLGNGGLPYFNADMINIQNYSADGFKQYLNELRFWANNSNENYAKLTFGSVVYDTSNYGIILSGGDVYDVTATTYSVASGVAFLKNSGEEVGEICTFEGAENLPIANKVWLARTEFPTITQKEALNGGSVDFYETFTATIQNEPPTQTIDPTPWVDEFCVWDVQFQGSGDFGWRESPSKYQYTLQRAQLLGSTLSADISEYFPSASLQGVGKFHGYKIANGTNGTLDWDGSSPAGGAVLQRI